MPPTDHKPVGEHNDSGEQDVDHRSTCLINRASPPFTPLYRRRRTTRLATAPGPRVIALMSLVVRAALYSMRLKLFIFVSRVIVSNLLPEIIEADADAVVTNCTCQPLHMKKDAVTAEFAALTVVQ